MTCFCSVDLYIYLPDFCNHLITIISINLRVYQSYVQTVISMLPLDITCADNEDAHDVLMTINIWLSQENSPVLELDALLFTR